MISQIFSESDFGFLPEKGVEAQKIRALFLAYGAEYDFCRFFRQGKSTFLSMLDKNAVLCCGKDADYVELSDFLIMSGFSELFCSSFAADKLSENHFFKRSDVTLMRFSGSTAPADYEHNPALSKMYEILRTSFDIEFEPWYLDMSHRMRHGVSSFAGMEGCCLCIQHDLNGEALLSQVATLPNLRGQGRAAALIKAVCAELSPSEVFVICEDSLVPFYAKVGFESAGRKSLLSL